MEEDRLNPPWSQNPGLTGEHSDHLRGLQGEKNKKYNQNCISKYTTSAF